MIKTLPPLSLYIHIPWCIKKCPYCDFNSHGLKNQNLGNIPEQAYVEQLLKDFTQDFEFIQNRRLHSIFIGGGTPSLFSAQAYEQLFAGIFEQITPVNNIEITLEANPGAVDEGRFEGFYAAGINRLSIGCQSFNDRHLKKLGRIHDHLAAVNAIRSAKQAGFSNFNIDLMFGLADQTRSEALRDLQMAVELQPSHLSWYQLTLEPNTLFHRFPPKLPDDDLIADIHSQGKQLLHQHGFAQYEISAFAKANQRCQHNLNYWQFGDYLAIGAGAHGKITRLAQQDIVRFVKHKHPKTYLQASDFFVEQKPIDPRQLTFEFMLNYSRLMQAIPFADFENRTGLSKDLLISNLKTAEDKGLVKIHQESCMVTEQGHQFLNDLQLLFLE